MKRLNKSVGRKSILIIGILLLPIFATSCSSRAAKKISKQIDDIGIVTVGSKEVLDAIDKEYQNLSEEEKLEVTNYDVFETDKRLYRQAVISDLERKATSLGVERIRDEIKKKLKSPKSYNEYSCDTNKAIILDGWDSTTMTATIKYGATNSYGAEITNTVTGVVSFDIDIDNQSVVVTGCTTSLF